MIELNEVSKWFKTTRKQRKEMGLEAKVKKICAMDRISFSCKPGRIFSLLGPNGAGKTTALRLIATMLKPSEGSIKVSGFDTVKQAGEVRKKIGFLTGSTGLYARLTPDELIQYYANLHGVDKVKFQKRRSELYSLLGIHEFSHRRIGKLSTGMKQKVSIVRTVIHDPEVVIFDEPTAGLDVVAARNIITLIRKCREEGKTVIFSTHIMGEVNLLSDDLAIIHQGHLLYNSTFSNFIGQMKTKSIEDEFIRMIEEN